MHGRQRSSSIVADREASREKQYNTLVVVDDDCVAAIFLHSASLRSCGLQFGCDTISSGKARKKVYLCTSCSCPFLTLAARVVLGIGPSAQPRCALQGAMARRGPTYSCHRRAVELRRSQRTLERVRASDDDPRHQIVPRYTPDHLCVPSCNGFVTS